jgi:hypothetical protein
VIEPPGDVGEFHPPYVASWNFTNDIISPLCHLIFELMVAG